MQHTHFKPISKSFQVLMLFMLCLQYDSAISQFIFDSYSIDNDFVSDYEFKVNFDLEPICGILGSSETGADVYLTTSSYGGNTLVFKHIEYNPFYILSYTGSYTYPAGPGYNQNLYAWAKHIYCYENGAETVLNCTTEPIFDPTDVSATDEDFDTKIVITWSKGTMIPDSLHQYLIYKNDLWLATVPGTSRSYEDTGLSPGQTYTYKVSTYADFWGGYTSPGVEDQGSTLNINLNATDGGFYKKTKLTWNDLSDHATDIRVERSLPAGGKEELDILNKNATTYTDLDGIAGYNYTYYVTPIDSTNSFQADDDEGYSKPNGKISGHVTSPQGAGVDSVSIFVQIDSALTNGGADLPLGCSATYCAMTDISGYYEIEDVYYYLGADFIIYPKKDTHHFSPDTLVRSLSENTTTQSFVDFTDLNVITVGGHVTYPKGPGSAGACGAKGVSILIGGRDLGILTDAHGDWSTSFNSEGTYSFSAKLHDHVYEDPQGNTTTTLHITSDRTNINFENKTTRIIHIIAQAGCNAPLGTSVGIEVTAPGGCFDSTYFTDASGLLTIDHLPPRNYSVSVTEVNGAGSNETNIEEQLDVPINIDLSELDTMLIITDADSLKITPPDTLYPPDTIIYIPADTMVVEYKDTMMTTEKSLRFIYRAPIDVKIDFEDSGADVYDCSGEEVVVMDQDHEYLLEINVKETLGNCNIDTGTLIIYDEISDKQGSGQKIPIKNGIARYLVQPGNPDIAVSTMHDHEKYLHIIPKVDFADPDPFTFWVLVTGIKSGAQDVTTRTPELPQLIIHDPPGDNSFATIEEGTTYTTTSSTEIQAGDDLGGFLNFKAGPQAKIFDFKIKGGALVEFEAKGGKDEMNNDVTINTITFLKDYSTSPDETFVGNPGDVFIGAAMNQIFSISQELTFDPITCETSLDSVVDMGFTSFATTFIYTEHHIMNSLLPTLETLKGQQDTLTNDGKMEYNKLKRDIDLWNQILANNAAARDTPNAEFRENISISSGADLTKSQVSVDGTQASYTYNSFFESKLKVGAFAEVDAPGVYIETEGGIMATFKTSSTEVKDTLNETTRTVTYTISDNDIGDYFSIDVLRDTVYDVPAFRIVAGRSSCPHEPNTAARESPTIGIFPPIVNNVPPDEAANFVLDITNNSEVGETRQYAVKVVSNTNPEGAIINVAGSDINTFPIQYYFDANQTIRLAMTVSKGPLASNYDSLGIEIYSECEYEIWGNGGNQTKSDTVWFSVNFLSECTNVSMYLPNQGWLVNQASNDTLHTTFTGYDIDNEFFEGITLQMKRDGYGYTDQAFIPKDSLTGPYYDYYFDVSGFPNDNYTIRAKADCGTNEGYTYSSELFGTIDRTSLAPFGTPTPSDGFLREGQEVSVSFDKVIDCNNSSPEISLVREDTDEEITFTTSCFGNKVIINTSPPLIDQLDLEGVLVTARVHKLQDENGNIQEYPTQWSFLVNVNPVFWDPENLVASGYEGLSHTIKGVLKNTSLLSKAYSLDTIDGPDIIDYPEWLTPLQKRGTVLPQNDFTVEFAVNPGLLPGLYSGTVTAMVDSLPVSMDVTFELLARPVYWPFDPTQFQYTLNVVAVFSLDNTNTNLSTDTRDMVAAFVNGEVRGITNLEYVPELNVYRAFLTVYSNNQGGGGAETVRFRFWHALNGVEYGAVETRTFTLDVNYGTVEAPLLLHPEGFFQVIKLNKGWTWISFNVATPDMSREHIFQNILNSPSNNIITVKSKTQTSTFTPPAGWNGNLTTLQLGQGYLVNLSNAPDTLRVVGFPSNTTISVPVATNWNWIGFPRLIPEPVNDVLENLTPAQGNPLKSQSEFATYNSALHSWIGNLNEFTPGEGYKLFLTTGGTIIFQPSRSDDYQFNPYLYEYNMNVTGFADLSKIGEHAEEDLIIGAFIDGECRGTGVMEYVESTHEFRTFMLVNGNVADLGKQIEFRIKNDITGNEYSTNGQQLTFIADGIIGTIPNPYLFFSTTTSVVNGDQEGYELKQSRPNPTGGLTSISFKMPRSEHVLLRLYDLNGELVKVIVDAEMNEGDHSIETDLTSLTGGIYYYELRTENFVGVKKLVKQ